ncbi:hypothetical protein CYY_002708 [Polysphondylium violaceum]|uniref:Transmembrane protein n=1 Tax=Polysphondylium violaceum TaxID=133409 RepID=A0A8J4Q7M4_9MYCE|nr:hypothetical protein CYY_002708 [Polysphondylium violaceum]
MVSDIFPIPFQWLIIAFGIGVPLIYLMVWISISPDIKSGKDNNNYTLCDHKIDLKELKDIEKKTLDSNGEYINEKIDVGQTLDFEKNPAEIHSLTQTLGQHLANFENQMDKKEINKSLSSSPNPPLNIESPPQLEIEKSELENMSQDGSLTSKSSQSLDISSDEISENDKQTGYEEKITIKEPQIIENKRSFLFKFWIVSSTLCLGPLGYVIFHLFLFAFYSVNNNVYQFILIIGFQIVILIYKFLFRLSFHRMRAHLPNIPLRVFQDARILFLFWLECSTHSFFSCVFPHVGSAYMIILYLAFEATALTLQIIVDTTTFRSKCIFLIESIYYHFKMKKYNGTYLYSLLGQNGELDRTVSLELFFFNCVARSLASFAYLVLSLAIYYGPNLKNYPTMDLEPHSYYLTLLYAAASVVTSLIHMIICRIILKKVYKMDLLERGVMVWKRRPDIAFFFILNCFILPLVVLLKQNNAVSYLLYNFKS